MVAVPLQMKELLNSLGPSAEVINSQVGQLGDGSLDKLKKLRSAYAVPTASIAKYQAAADRSSDLPPFGFNPLPKDALSNLAPAVGATYFNREVAPHSTAGDPFSALLDRFTRRGQILAMAIHRRADLRTGVERIAVGRVLPDGRNDGAITIETEKAKAQGVQTSAMVGEQIEQAARSLPPHILQQFLEIYYSQSSFGPFGLFTSGMDGSTGSGSPSFSGYTGESFEGSSGLDTDILKLKRMIDKRTHATDLYSQTLTAYNNSARNIVEKLRA